MIHGANTEDAVDSVTVQIMFHTGDITVGDHVARGRRR